MPYRRARLLAAFAVAALATAACQSDQNHLAGSRATAPAPATTEAAAPAASATPAPATRAVTATPSPAPKPSPSPTRKPAAPPPPPPPPPSPKPAPIRTTAAPKPVAASTCGAPANSWGYNFCGRGGFVYDPAASFCDVFDCIPSFWDSTNGYVMQCSDLTYSHSGGRSGSCSHHGGNYRALYG